MISRRTFVAQTAGLALAVTRRRPAAGPAPTGSPRPSPSTRAPPAAAAPSGWTTSRPTASRRPSTTRRTWTRSRTRWACPRGALLPHRARRAGTWSRATCPPPISAACSRAPGGRGARGPGDAEEHARAWPCPGDAPEPYEVVSFDSGRQDHVFATPLAPGWPRSSPTASEWRGDFERLNREWIETWFTLEEADRETFRDPVGKIVAPGGQIFFVVDGDGGAAGPAPCSALGRRPRDRQDGGGAGGARAGLRRPADGRGVAFSRRRRRRES